MSHLHKLTIKAALNGLKNKDFSSVELTQAHFTQIKKHQGLNAYITLDEEGAMSAAVKADKNIAAGNMGLLEGIPVGVKDLFCTKGIRTTACSKMLSNFIPEYNSTVFNKMLANGAVMLGKTNCDEFAMGSSNLTSYFGKCINPWRSKTAPEKELVPGGSSGGSACAVASFTAMATLGTDTGGSIRQPAAFTGTVGIKPTYGRCSRFGVIAFASSLDQPGVFARSVYDAALALEAIMGFDEKDSTSTNLEVPNLLKDIDAPVTGVKIGIPVNLLKQEGIDPQITQMWMATADALKAQGCELVDVELKHANYALPVYYVIAPAEASSNLARYDGVRYGFSSSEATNLNDLYELSRSAGFGAEVKRRIMIGTHVLSAGFIDAYYTQAQKVRRLIYNDFMDAFTKVDAILMPSAPTESFAVDVKQDNPIDMYLNDIFTIPPSLAGLPASSVPAALSKNGLPLGMQVVGKHFDEVMVVRISQAIERSFALQLIADGF